MHKFLYFLFRYTLCMLFFSFISSSTGSSCQKYRKGWRSRKDLMQISCKLSFQRGNSDDCGRFEREEGCWRDTHRLGKRYAPAISRHLFPLRKMSGMKKIELICVLWRCGIILQTLCRSLSRHKLRERRQRIICASLKQITRCIVVDWWMIRTEVVTKVNLANIFL